LRCGKAAFLFKKYFEVRMINFGAKVEYDDLHWFVYALDFEYEYYGLVRIDDDGDIDNELVHMGYVILVKDDPYEFFLTMRSHYIEMEKRYA